MNLKNLKHLSYAYLILPIIFFFIGWLKLYWSIPLSIFTIIAAILANKESNNDDDEKVIIRKRYIFLIFIVLLIFCILAGQGGLFYQSNDHHWRNAIFRDLINKDWPVFYPKSDTFLNYYIGHWLVPAGIAKIFVPISESLAWSIGNIALLLWSAIGVTLTFLWILKGIEKKNIKNIIIAILIFIFFSGLDIIGCINSDNIVFSDMHIEWWAKEYQFSSMSTQLFWVFNQSIAAWLITMMFLTEKNVKNYFLLIILLLPYAPLPFLGAIPLFACNGFRILYKSIKEKNVKEFFKDAFSIQNIMALVCILPIYYFYYSTNTATASNGLRLLTDLITLEGIINLLIFWFLEIGIYGTIMWKKYKKSPLFWVAFMVLILIPVFALGNARDLAMRASIPALVVCMIFVIDFLVNKSEDLTKTLKYAMIVVLIIGAVTPVFEFSRAITTVVKNKEIRSVADEIVTFSNKNAYFYQNFLASTGANDPIFLRYFMKEWDLIILKGN